MFPLVPTSVHIKWILFSIYKKRTVDYELLVFMIIKKQYCKEKVFFLDLRKA